MTRGDGGQNLIGTELREGLGLIRTQELIEARKIDGGEQFFTTAMTLDFQSIQKKHFQFGMKKKFYLKLFFVFVNLNQT